MKASETHKLLYHYSRILNAGTSKHPNSVFLDPYLKNGSQGIGKRIGGWFETNRTTKSLEKQFVDFKPFYVDTQFREIYSELYFAYRKRDLVILQRSLSDNMYEYFKQQVRRQTLSQNEEEESSRKTDNNPFLKKIQRVHLVQARKSDSL